MPDAIEIRPVTSDRWDELLVLFGDRGAYSGCWCQWFRVKSSAWTRNGNAGNRALMEGLVERDEVPGLLAYRDGTPVGWVSVAPRDGFERIVGDPETAIREEMADPPISPVWAITCFYIDRDHRGSGVANALLAAAIDHAFVQGAQSIEAYPVEPEGRTDNAGAFTGLRTMFEKAGFREVGRFDRWRAAPTASQPSAKPLARPPGRPVMRLRRPAV